MPYYAWPAESFGGLDLLNDPDEVGWGGAIDLLNVSFDRLGRVRSRDGYTNIINTTAYIDLRPVALTAAGNNVCLARGGATGTDLIGAAGVNASTAGQMSGSTAIVATPTTIATYIPCGASTIQKLVGTTFSSPAGMPAASCLAVTPWDNRLVAADTGAVGGPAGAASSESHVWFSNPGAPETWGANNFIELNPGDGQFIRATVAWRELLFVFKESRFYVFTGTSTDSAGNPIFNYRTIDTGVGIGRSANGMGSAIAGPDALYFSNRNGIWRTTGGPPVLISDPVASLMPDPQRSLSPFYTGPSFPATSDSWTLAIFRNRLYAAPPGGNGMAVYDFTTQTWTIWDVSVKALLAYNIAPQSLQDSRIGLYFALAAGGIGNINPASPVATDNGAVITSRYQSGFNKFSYKSHFRYIGYGEEKTVRQTQLYGQGTPTLTWFRDFQTTAVPGSGNAVPLGTAPATGRGLDRAAARGEALSFKFSATTAWQVDSLEAMIRGERPVGEETT